MMNKSASEVLQVFTPPFYIPEGDEPLTQSVQAISDYRENGGISGHFLAVAQGVCSIARAFFINILYYLGAGTGNLLLNCVHLSFDRPVLIHYGATVQSLIYSIIATVYVAVGIIIPPVLSGFKIEVQEKPKDPPLPVDGFGINNSLVEEDVFEPVVLNQLVDPDRSVDRADSVERRDARSILGNPSGISVQVVPDRRDHPLLVSPPQGVEGRVVDLERQIPSSNPRPAIQMGDRHVFHIRKAEDREIIPLKSPIPDDWEIVPAAPLALGPVGVQARETIGANGANLERQAFRVAMDEYTRVLEDRFGVDLDAQIATVEGWLKDSAYRGNPMVIALYRTLTYLKYPYEPSWVRRKGEPPYSDAKSQYEVYVNTLRAVIATEQYQAIRTDQDIMGVPKECRDIVRKLCEARFSPEIYTFLGNLFQLHEAEHDRLHPVDIPPVTRENFAQVVKAKNDKVRKAPASMKVSSNQRRSRMPWGAVGLEDFLMTDIPFMRGLQVFKDEQGEERTFHYYRHPTPHMPGSAFWVGLGVMARATHVGNIESRESIAPEFEEMLYALEERGEAYLIQSHQRLNDSGKLENEDSRCQTLYRLQESHRNFHVVFQGVEGPLFNRQDEYAKVKTFAELKTTLKASFYDKLSPNRLPDALQHDKEYHDRVIDRLLDTVHHTLFDGRDDISFDGDDAIREWQAFILAFYILQGDDLKFRLANVKYFCTNCKNLFDRGGSRAMAEDRFHQEMSGNPVTREQLEETVNLLVPVPLQSKGKGVIDHRLEPALGLVNILTHLSDEARARLQEINFGGFKPDRFEVNKREHQRAVPLVEDARTPQEMQELFRALQGERQRLTDDQMAQKNWDVYSRRDRASLFHQVDRDLPSLDIRIDGTRYDGSVGFFGGKYNAEGIYRLLTETHNISDEVALKVLAQIQQSIFADPLNGLNVAFEHRALDLKVAHAPIASIYVRTTGDEIEARKQFQYVANDCESAHFRDRPYAIFDSTVSLSIPKNGGEAKGHWTWGVAAIPE